MKISLFPAIALCSSLALFANLATAKDDAKVDAQKPVQKAVEAKFQNGKADPNASGDEPKNSITPEVKTRAGTYSCDIHIDNRTNYVIHRVYIDGRRWGSVGRHGDAIARDVAAGQTTVYAEADFSDGSTKSVGPRVFNCNSWSTHRWVVGG